MDYFFGADHEYLFGNKNVEKILIYLFLHEKAIATELRHAFNSSLDPIQKTLKKLEEGGLLVSFLEGRTRVYQWNTRYPFLQEIQALAKRAHGFLPSNMQESCYQSKKASTQNWKAFITMINLSNIDIKELAGNSKEQWN